MEAACPTEFNGGATYFYWQYSDQGSDGHWYCVTQSDSTDYGTCEDESVSIVSITGTPRDCSATRRSGQCCSGSGGTCDDQCYGDLCVPTSGSCFGSQCPSVSYYQNCRIPY